MLGLAGEGGTFLVVSRLYEPNRIGPELGFVAASLVLFSDRCIGGGCCYRIRCLVRKKEKKGTGN